MVTRPTTSVSRKRRNCNCDGMATVRPNRDLQRLKIEPCAFIGGYVTDNVNIFPLVGANGPCVLHAYINPMYQCDSYCMYYIRSLDKNTDDPWRKCLAFILFLFFTSCTRSELSLECNVLWTTYNFAAFLWITVCTYLTNLLLLKWQ